MTITVERYLKVVHPFWSKKNLKRWMIYAAMVFAWVGGILSIAPATFISTIVDDGICLAYYVWESVKVRIAINLWIFFSFLVVPVILFVFCYARIVVVMRRQMKVMAAHNAQGSTQMSASQMQSKRIKWNIIKTMIIVSVAFVICWSPQTIYPVVIDITEQMTSTIWIGYSAAVFLSYLYNCVTVFLSYLGYLYTYATVFLSYLYICMNPFIYAFKHEGVKEKLTRLMVCRKRAEVAAVGDGPGTGSNDTRRNVVVGTGETGTAAHQ